MKSIDRMATATAAAYQATAPTREALAEAGRALIEAKENMSRLEAEHYKVWNDTLSQSLKEGE